MGEFEITEGFNQNLHLLSKLFPWKSSVVSLVVTMVTIWTIKRLLRSFTWKRQRQLEISGSDLGPWALVTGATDGIGKAFVEHLSSLGINMVLVSRSSEKLGDLAIQLNTKYGVKVRTIAMDFTHGVEIYPKIQLALEGLEITTLINNVGMSYPSPSYLDELEDSTCVQLLNCNILSATMMMKLLLPSMVARQKGFIVNVGSMASEVSFPFLSLYAATKAFLDKLSNDVGLEYRDKGIFIQSLVPACVATKMSHIQQGSFFAPTPEKFVSSALAELVARKRRTPGCRPHRVQMIWFRFLKICSPCLFEKWNFSVMSRWRLGAQLKHQFQ